MTEPGSKNEDTMVVVVGAGTLFGWMGGELIGSEMTNLAILIADSRSEQSSVSRFLRRKQGAGVSERGWRSFFRGLFPPAVSLVRPFVCLSLLLLFLPFFCSAYACVFVSVCLFTLRRTCVVHACVSV